MMGLRWIAVTVLLVTCWLLFIVLLMVKFWLIR